MKMKMDLNSTAVLDRRTAMDIDNYLYIYYSICSKIREIIKDYDVKLYNEESEYFFNCITEKIEISKMLDNLDTRKALISRIKNELNIYRKNIDGIEIYCSSCKNIDYKKLDFIENRLFNLSIDSLKNIDSLLYRKKLRVLSINTIVILLSLLLVLDIYYILLAMSLFIVSVVFIVNYRYCKIHCNISSLYQVKDIFQIVDNKPLFTYNIVKNLNSIFAIIAKDTAI